jgi:Domain of unknown function (DUF4139)/N-terminal domain of unknown function (DUF4140)
MWKALCLSLAAWLVANCTLAAEDIPPAASDQVRTTTSRIIQVTVYQSDALVTREVDVPEGVGTMELVVTPLPPQTVNSSLYSEGGDGIRVMNTRFRTRALQEDRREGVRKLETRIKELAAAAQKLQGDIRTTEQNLQLLAKMENFTTATLHTATSKGALDSKATIDLAKYVMDERAARSKELVALQQQLQTNQEQTQFAQRQLQELAAGASRTERDAVIVIDKRNAAAGTVRLNYLVDSASWRPQYKLRASAQEKEPVKAEYLAAVVQQSGEDWSNVNLILSTAQPMLNAAPPELKTLEVTVVPRASAASQPQPAGSYAALANQGALALEQHARSLRGKAQQEFNRRNDEQGNWIYNTAAALEQAEDLLRTKEELSASADASGGRGRFDGPSVTFHLQGKLSVPSRHDEQVIEVARLDLAPDYYFRAVPVLTPQVYRLANLTNRSAYVLLPGEATMYLGTDFVGRMNLPLVAIGEQFTAGFGVDPQLQVQRQLVDKSRTTQGGNQVLKYEYRILVNSYKSEPVKLQVWDRLPRAENETAGVSLVKVTPEVSTDPVYLREQRPSNLLRWDLRVAPSTTGEKATTISYEFKLELDRQMLITNVLTK